MATEVGAVAEWGQTGRDFRIRSANPRGGGGAIPGAFAGAEVAGNIGFALLISFVLQKTAQLGFSIYQLASGNLPSSESIAEAKPGQSDQATSQGLLALDESLTKAVEGKPATKEDVQNYETVEEGEATDEPAEAKELTGRDKYYKNI